MLRSLVSALLFKCEVGMGVRNCGMHRSGMLLMAGLVQDCDRSGVIRIRRSVEGYIL